MVNGNGNGNDNDNGNGNGNGNGSASTGLGSGISSGSGSVSGSNKSMSSSTLGMNPSYEDLNKKKEDMDIYNPNNPNNMLNSKCDPMLLEDHRLYYSINAANPVAMRQTFLYCIQTNDTDLTRTILRDVGIAYLLRNCMLHAGLFYETLEYMDRRVSILGSSSSATTSAMGTSTSMRTTIKATGRSTSPGKSAPGSPSKDRNNNSKRVANIFWLAAFYGSAEVLELILQETWVHFAETALNNELQQRQHRKKMLKLIQQQQQLQLQQEKEKQEQDLEEKEQQSKQASEQQYEPPQEEEINYKLIEQNAKKELSKILNESASSYGITPLFIAVTMNHKHIISILLQYDGVDPNKANNERGTTPAIIASYRGNTDALEGLAECPLTNFNQANERKVTPLLAACQNGCINSVRYLTNLRRPRDDGDDSYCGIGIGIDESKHECDDDYEVTSIGSNSNIDVPIVNCRCQNSAGYGCASIAAQHNQNEVIIYLCQIHDPKNNGIDVNQKNSDKDGDSAIHVAVKFNRCSIVKSLMEMIPRTCDIMATNKYGMTALHIAAKLGHTQIVKDMIRCLSLEYVKNYDVEDSYGMTPVFYATLGGYEEIVNLLAPISEVKTLRCVQFKKKSSQVKKRGMNKKKKQKAQNRADMTKQNLLHIAASYGYVNIVYTLLHCGADVNKQDTEGCTALYLASKVGHFEVVKILVENGADPKIKSRRGKMPLAKARKYKRHDIIDFLVQHGGR